MKKLIRDYSRDVIALMFLALVSFIVLYVVLTNQRFRFPIFEEKPFTMNLEMSTALAVEPGQGQTIRVAGVEIGEISGVEVRNGKALVSAAVDRNFLPVYKNATALLRPKTALKDMFIELDPGDPSAGRLEEGGIISSANTLPDVNLDEILKALDGDVRDYLTALISSGGKGLKGNSKQLGELFRQFGPLNRGLSRLNTEQAKRSKNIRRNVNNFNELMAELADNDEQLKRFVKASDTSLGAIADEKLELRRGVRLLPGALQQTTRTLGDVDTFAQVLRPTLADLRPFARRADDLNESLRSFARETTPIVRDEIRPFVRESRPVVQDLRPVAKQLADASPDLVTDFTKLNRFFNNIARNPKGREAPGTAGRDEGYLYWAAWVAHNGNSLLSTQDAHGATRRVYLLLNCENLVDLLSQQPEAGLVANLGQTLSIACP